MFTKFNANSETASLLDVIVCSILPLPWTDTMSVRVLQPTQYILQTKNYKNIQLNKLTGVKW